MQETDALYRSFLDSTDTVWFMRGGSQIFRSQLRGIAPLLDYLDRFGPSDGQDIVIFDRVVGNAAALLMKLAGCGEVRAPLASGHAVATLEELGIDHHFQQVVPHIVNRQGSGMCPFEKLSLGTTAAEFYPLAQSTLKRLNEGNTIS